jgi:hypothetical protein
MADEAIACTAATGGIPTSKDFTAKTPLRMLQGPRAGGIPENR